MTKHVTLIHALLSDEGTPLREVMEIVQLADGEILFNRGDPGDAFYIIESGQVRIFTLDEEGQELTLNTLGPQEAFGELALLDDRPRSASAAALGDTTVRRLRRKEFLSRVHASPELTQTVINLISQRARHMTDYIERLAHWARLVAEGHYNQAMASIQAEEGVTDRALAAVGDAVKSMIKAVREREEKLKQEVTQLRIEIDEVKRKQMVQEITESEHFTELTKKIQELRKQSKR